MRAVRFTVLLVALFILGGMVSIPNSYAVCGTGTWNGNAGDGKWETAGNWSGNCVPDASAVIPNDAFVVTISTSQSLTGSVFVGTGDTLICTSACTLTVSTDYVNNPGGTLTNSGTISVSGTFFNDDGATVTNVGTITVSGAFVNSPSATVTSSGTISVSGTFFNDPGATLTNSGPIAVSGDFVNSPSATVTNFGTITVSGKFFNDPGATVTNFGKVSILGDFVNVDGRFIDKCGGTVNKAPTFGNSIETPPCVVGGEVLSLDYGSLMFSAVPWILIIATLAAATAIILRQKFKLFH